MPYWRDCLMRACVRTRYDFKRLSSGATRPSVRPPVLVLTRRSLNLNISSNPQLPPSPFQPTPYLTQQQSLCHDIRFVSLRSRRRSFRGDARRIQLRRRLSRRRRGVLRRFHFRRPCRVSLIHVQSSVGNSVGQSEEQRTIRYRWGLVAC